MNGKKRKNINQSGYLLILARAGFAQEIRK